MEGESADFAFFGSFICNSYFLTLQFSIISEQLIIIIIITREYVHSLEMQICTDSSP